MSFIDYYEIMQISPNAEVETVHRVFRMLAARYHPDNPETGDNDKFLLLQQAYEVLSDPQARGAFNMLHERHRQEPLAIFGMKEFTGGVEGEANRRMGVLCLLYHKRRTNPDGPGMSILDLETLMNVPREHLMFTLWYLREKNLIRFTEKSDYEITGQGIDSTEEQYPKNDFLQKLLDAPKPIKPEPARPEGRTVSAGPLPWNGR